MAEYFQYFNSEQGAHYESSQFSCCHNNYMQENFCVYMVIIQGPQFHSGSSFH